MRYATYCGLGLVCEVVSVAPLFCGTATEMPQVLAVALASLPDQSQVTCEAPASLSRAGGGLAREGSQGA